MATGRRHVRNWMDYFYLATGVLIAFGGLVYGNTPVNSRCGSAFSPTIFYGRGDLGTQLQANVDTAQCALETQPSLLTASLIILAGVVITIVAGIWLALGISPSAAAIIEAQEDQALLDRYSDDA